MAKKVYRKIRKRHRKRRVDFAQSGDKEVQKSGHPKVDMVIYKGIGLPSQFFTKLKWNYIYSFNTSYFEDKYIRMNSVFDPDPTVVGGSPTSVMYHNELSTLYDYYTVYASKINVTFIMRTNTTEASFQKVGIYPLHESTVVPNATTLSLVQATTRDNCVYAQLGPNTGDQGIISMQSYAKVASVLGIKKGALGIDDTLQSFVANTPSQECYWHIFAGSLDGSTTSNVYADIEITYYVKYHKKGQIDNST